MGVGVSLSPWFGRLSWHGVADRVGKEGEQDREGRKSYIRFTTWICITGHSVLWCFTLLFLFVYLSGPVETPGSGRGHLDGVQLELGLMA